MNEDNHKVLKCEQCGAEFTGYKTRCFCDECRRQRNIAIVRRRTAELTPEEREQRLNKRREYYKAHRQGVEKIAD